jgi:glycosyltransferase involved in cell wall biosynthesis
MLGAVSDGQVKALYQNALCLVFPSLYEGYGLPPLEAMLCGCPVVASRAASMLEVCGNAALYAEPGDADGMAAQIQRLRRDPALRAAMIGRGLAHVQGYSWAATASRLAETFSELGAS